MYKKRALYKRKKNPLKVAPVEEPTTKTKAINSAKGKDNGKTRTVPIVKAVSPQPVGVAGVAGRHPTGTAYSLLSGNPT